MHAGNQTGLQAHLAITTTSHSHPTGTLNRSSRCREHNSAWTAPFAALMVWYPTRPSDARQQPEGKTSIIINWNYSPAAIPNMRVPTHAWNATGATKRGTAPTSRGMLCTRRRNSPFQTRIPPGGGQDQDRLRCPDHNGSYCNSSFTANHKSDSLINIHFYLSLSRAAPPERRRGLVTSLQ
jgi:hypothetical protein